MIKFLTFAIALSAAAAVNLTSSVDNSDITINIGEGQANRQSDDPMLESLWDDVLGVVEVLAPIAVEAAVKGVQAL